MSSLWTPDGEVPVGRRREQPPAPGRRPGGEPAGEHPTGAAAPAAGGEPGTGADEAEARAALDEARRQILAVPASTVVANHVMGLYELAAIHLSAEAPDWAAAALAIDAMGALVDALAGRLGPDEDVLRDALAQVRMAFVQRRNRTERA